MPITLNCACGKTLRVADEHAGKRVKCPACAAVLTAARAGAAADGPPPPPAASAPVGKPAADEDDRGAYELEPAAKAASVPEFRKGATRDEDDEDADDAPRRRARGRPGHAARRSGKERAQR